MIEELQQALAEIDEQPAAQEMNLSDDDSSDSDDSDYYNSDGGDSDNDSDDGGIFPPVFSFINVLACIGICGGASCYFGAFGQLDKKHANGKKPANNAQPSLLSREDRSASNPYAA